MRRAVQNVYLGDWPEGAWYGPDYEPMVPDELAATVTAPGVFEGDTRTEVPARVDEDLTPGERAIVEAQADAAAAAEKAIAENAEQVNLVMQRP